MKVVRLWASRTGRLYSQEIFLVLIFNRDWVDPRAMVRSEGMCHWKIQWHHGESTPGNVRLVAQRLNHYATPGSVFHRVLYYSNNSTFPPTIHNHISLNTIDCMLAIDSFVRRYFSPTLSGNTSHGVVLTPYYGFFQIPSQSAIK